MIDIGGARDLVPEVDIKIRRIKEVCKSMKAALPWTCDLSWSLCCDPVWEKGRARKQLILLTD